MVRAQIGLAALSAIVICATGAQARWKPEYAAITADERAWYERQQTTPETRTRLKAEWYKSCCDHADTVNAKFEKRGGGWVYQLEGETTWRSVPQDIVQIDVATPHGKPVLFVDGTHLHAGPICFFPGAAGT